MTSGPSVDGATYRAAMARLAGAVHLVTTDGPGGRAGFTATAVCSVSDAPPTLLVCINRDSSAYPAFNRNGRLCVNLLAAGHEALAEAFGRRPLAERFSEGDWHEGRGGGPVLDGALAAFEQVFHATGHDRYVTVQQDRQRTSPAPSPDDPLR